MFVIVAVQEKINELTQDMEDDDNIDLTQFDDTPISNRNNVNNQYRVTSLSIDKRRPQLKTSMKDVNECGTQ